MNVATRFLGFGLASLSGCLWFIACPPFDQAYLAWLAAVPMLFAVDRAATFKGALFLGWWAGVVETAGGFYWLIDTTQRFAGFPWIAAAGVLLVFCAARALIFLVFTALVRGVRRRRRVPMAVLAPLAMAIGEFVVPQVFTCGQWISQAWHPLVIQIAELGGPLTVTALLMLVNGALYDLLTRAPLARRSVLAAAGVLAATLVFGAVRMRQIDALVAAAPHLAIGLVQPNFAYTMESDLSGEEAVRELTALQEQSRRLEHAGAHLIVWSEGSYPVALSRDFTADFPSDSLAMIRRGFDTPVIIGTDTVDMVPGHPTTPGAAYNSALLLDRHGNATGRYDKVRLLAFGEYIPAIEYFPWIRRLLPEGAGQFTAGTGPGVMALRDEAGRDWRLAPVICYEDLLPGFLRRVGRLQPNLLVNLTSDQWFGARTEPFEHLALAVFGSIELRVSMVRAVNSGISALIDPNGRVVAKSYAADPYLEPHAPDGILVSAPRMAGGHTPFVAWGDWFVYLCLLANACILVAVHRGRRGRGRRAL